MEKVHVVMWLSWAICAALPLSPSNPIAVGDIAQLHQLPEKYHTTDDILHRIQNLASTCAQPANFRLEMRSLTNTMDLEKTVDTGVQNHGKSDEFFDYVEQHPLHDTAMVQLDKPPQDQAADQWKSVQSSLGGLPASWADKSVPPADLPIVRISLPGEASQPKYPGMLMFGEHGRELISSEIALDFLAQIHSVVCDSAATNPGTSAGGPQLAGTNLLEIQESEYGTNTPYSKGQIRNLLSRWDLAIMPIVSPSARELAERRDFCNRKNSNGIDVNRNYPFHFTKGLFEPNSEQFPGNAPLTEPETRIAAHLAEQVRPKLFVAVHSGAEMIVTSPAYRKMSLSQLPRGVQKVVQGIQTADCPECDAGPASQVLSYLAYGCSMDYMFEEGFSSEENPTKATQEHFSFTFETWAGDKEQSRIASMDFEREFQSHAPTMRAMDDRFNALRSAVGDHQFDCLSRFNPPPSLYDRTVHKWSKALLSTMDGVMKELDATSAAAPATAVPPQPVQAVEPIAPIAPVAPVAPTVAVPPLAPTRVDGVEVMMAPQLKPAP